MTKINYWYLVSLTITLIIALPILTVSISFFGSTSDYYYLLKNTFLFSYINQSLMILIGVLFLTFLFGVFSAYFVSFYDFPGVNFFKWALILSFAVPAYIYAYSLTAFLKTTGHYFQYLLGCSEKEIITFISLNLMECWELFYQCRFLYSDMFMF